MRRGGGTAAVSKKRRLEAEAKKKLSSSVGLQAAEPKSLGAGGSLRSTTRTQNPSLRMDARIDACRRAAVRTRFVVECFRPSCEHVPSSRPLGKRGPFE